MVTRRRAAAPRAMTDDVLSLFDRLLQAHGVAPVDAFEVAVWCMFERDRTGDWPAEHEIVSRVSKAGELDSPRELPSPNGST